LHNFKIVEQIFIDIWITASPLTSPPPQKASHVPEYFLALNPSHTYTRTQVRLNLHVVQGKGEGRAIKHPPTLPHPFPDQHTIKPIVYPLMIRSRDLSFPWQQHLRVRGSPRGLPSCFFFYFEECLKSPIPLRSRAIP